MDEFSLDETRAARETLRTSHRHAFMRLAQILFEEDPVGINFEGNTDEYEAEAGTILPKLSRCETVEEIQELLHSEFIRWFDINSAGPGDQYRSAAERIRAEMVGWALPRAEHGS